MVSAPIVKARKFTETSMDTRLTNTLSELRSWRERMVNALTEKREVLQREKQEAIDAYDDEIAEIDVELRQLGIGVKEERPSDISVKALNYLLENPGQK